MLARGCVIAGGILSLVMFLFHTQFNRLFEWEAEYQSLGLANQRIFYTIHLALLLLFLVFGVLSLLYSRELCSPSGLAVGLLCGYSLFWVWRAVWQITYSMHPACRYCTTC